MRIEFNLKAEKKLFIPEPHREPGERLVTLLTVEVDDD